jgi:GT2 family glycosyltransferase
VVDAASRDGTLGILESLHDPVLEVKQVPGCTEAEGQQFGAGHRPADFIFFTNSDTYVPSDWIRRHVEWHEKGYDIVSGGVFQAGDLVNFVRNVRTTGKPRKFPTNGATLGFVNFSVRSELLRRAGGIRDLPSQHDAEFVDRALDVGASVIIDPGIEVIHDHPLGSLRNAFARSYGYSANHRNARRKSVDAQLRADLSGVAAWELGKTRVLSELSGIEPWRAYRAFAPRTPPNLRRPGFVRFFWLRAWGFTAGELLATGVGWFRRPSEARLKDIHGNRAT